MAGRKSLKQELQVVKYMAELEPKFFNVLKNALVDPERKYWAIEQLGKLYAKAVPQKIGGDPDNPLHVIPIYGGLSKHNSNKENLPTVKAD